MMKPRPFFLVLLFACLTPVLAQSPPKEGKLASIRLASKQFRMHGHDASVVVNLAEHPAQVFVRISYPGPDFKIGAVSGPIVLYKDVSVKLTTSAGDTFNCVPLERDTLSFFWTSQAAENTAMGAYIPEGAPAPDVLWTAATVEWNGQKQKVVFERGDKKQSDEIPPPPRQGQGVVSKP